MSNGDIARPTPQSSRKRFRASAVVRGVLLGIVLATLGIGLTAWLLRPAPLPRLTEEALDAAVDRWRQHGPQSYNLDIEQTGRQSGQFHLEVRGGVPVAMT